MLCVMRAATSAIRAVCDLTVMHTLLLLLPTSASITCNKAQASHAATRLPTRRKVQGISIQVVRSFNNWREKVPSTSMFRVRAAATAVCKSQQRTSLLGGNRASADCWLGCCCCLACTSCICAVGCCCSCCCSSCCLCCRLSCCCCSCC